MRSVRGPAASSTRSRTGWWSGECRQTGSARSASPVSAYAWQRQRQPPKSVVRRAQVRQGSRIRSWPRWALKAFHSRQIRAGRRCVTLGASRPGSAPAAGHGRAVPSGATVRESAPQPPMRDCAVPSMQSGDTHTNSTVPAASSRRLVTVSRARSTWAGVGNRAARSRDQCAGEPFPELGDGLAHLATAVPEAQDTAGAARPPARAGAAGRGRGRERGRDGASLSDRAIIRCLHAPPRPATPTAHRT